MKPYISIIVPIYNNEKYLERCVKSICGQTLRNIEVVLVDDGSVDGSGKICDELAGKDSRIKVIHKPNGGVGSARLAGTAIANAQWIGFVDSDDWIEDSMYERLYAAATDYRADVVIQGYVEEVGNKCAAYRNNIRDDLYEEDKKLIFIRNMICCRDFFCMGIQPYLVNKLFKRDLLWSHLQDMDPEIRVGEDAAIVFPVLVKARRIAVTSDCCYHYCLRGDSMMYTEREEQREYENAMRLHGFLKRSFVRYGQYEAVGKSLDRYTVHNLLTRAMGYIVREIDMPSGKEIILYGAGAFGKSLYRYLGYRDVHHIHLWVDKKAQQLARMGFPVSSPDEIEAGENGLVLIALLNVDAVAEVRMGLERRGFQKEQIVWAMDVLQLTELEL
ncbi:glycosyltransferase family 2 protein [bacterium D16-50]|nr:glycosyltransferase family 2 protein [bacterium D16-50]